MLDLTASTRKSAWFAKDQAKARRSNKFIGRGSPASSTDAYRRAVGALANCGRYDSTDVVFISAEGARHGRLEPDFAEIRRAIAANVTFVTDGPEDRNRSYNCGERAIASFLNSQRYIETAPGIWKTADRFDTHA